MALAAPTLARLATATGAAWAAGGLAGRALALVGIEARMHDRQFCHFHPKLGADATNKGHSTRVAKLAVPSRLRELCPCRHKRRLRGRPRHASFAVARSKIEARHRHRPVDRRLSGDYAVDCVCALRPHPVVMHHPIDVDHDLGHGAGHGPTDSTATYVGLVDLACLLSIARGGRPPCQGGSGSSDAMHSVSLRANPFDLDSAPSGAVASDTTAENAHLPGLIASSACAAHVPRVTKMATTVVLGLGFAITEM